VPFLQRQVHHAYLDLEAIDARSMGWVTVDQALSALTFEFTHPCGELGRLQFPRFVIGQITRRMKLNEDDPEQARRQIVRELRSRRRIDEVVKLMHESAGAALTSVPTRTSLPTVLINRVLSTFGDIAVRVAPKLVLGDAQDWYGHRDRGLDYDPIAVLLRLNHWSRDPVSPADQERIDELLVAAFLSDLRRAFYPHDPSDWPFNCVVLLDNCDTDLGRKMLSCIVQIRRDYISRDDGPDPLTIVATSRGGLLADVEPTEVKKGRNNVEWQPDRSGTSDLWLRYRLPTLSLRETHSMVTSQERELGDDWLLAEMLHRFTGGHPGATRYLLEVSPSEHAADWSLSTVLATAPGGSDQTSAQRLRHMMLDGIQEVAWDDLVTCSAARRRSHAIELVARHRDLLTVPAVTEEVLWHVPLWTDQDDRFPTMLRRLLLFELAARGGSVSPGLPDWSMVHSLLARVKVARNRSDLHALADELTYALADGELESVTRQLASQDSTCLSGTDWLDLLDSVTLAPSRLDLVTAVKILIPKLTGWATAQPVSIVANLVSCYWLLADPQRVTQRRELHARSAGAYADLRQHWPHWATEFLARQRHHEHIANQQHHEGV
jgi:hypothetical protein